MGISENPFTFGGQWGVMQEPGTSLYYMRFRYYDSASARFLSRDPIRSRSPFRVNPYQYARENPVSYGDPTGLLETLIEYNGTNYWAKEYDNGYGFRTEDGTGVYIPKNPRPRPKPKKSEPAKKGEIRFYRFGAGFFDENMTGTYQPYDIALFPPWWQPPPAGPPPPAGGPPSRPGDCPKTTDRKPAGAKSGPASGAKAPNTIRGVEPDDEEEDDAEEEPEEAGNGILFGSATFDPSAGDVDPAGAQWFSRPPRSCNSPLDNDLFNAYEAWLQTRR